MQPYWSVYGQYGKGQNIPPTSIFDVKGAQVATLPKPILTDTVQFGSVWKSSRATLDVDFYHINFQNDYSSTTDPVTGDTLYFLTSDSITQGVEAESTILVGGGLAVYLNGTKGTAKYNDTELWVQNAPSDTETIGADLQPGQLERRPLQQAGRPDVQRQRRRPPGRRRSIRSTSRTCSSTTRCAGRRRLSQSRIRFAVNNLTDSHAITGVTPGVGQVRTRRPRATS